MAADRGAYIDQSQSMNIHMKDPDYGKLTSMHFHAWSKGLKTGMYYLRTKPATDAIKFTLSPEEVKQAQMAHENKLISTSTYATAHEFKQIEFQRLRSDVSIGSDKQDTEEKQKEKEPTSDEEETEEVKKRKFLEFRARMKAMKEQAEANPEGCVFSCGS